MGILTRLQICDLVKATLDDKDKLEPLVMNQFVINSHRRVQLDLMSLGVKTFTKTSILTCAPGFVACPSDMIALQDAIIDVRATTGARADFSIITVGSQTITITLLEPGINGNSTTIGIYDDLSSSPPTIIEQPSTTGLKNFTLYFNNGVTTLAQWASVFTTNLYLKQYYSIATTGAAGAVNIASLPIASGHPSHGTGNDFIPAREYSIEDFARLSSNTFTSPGVNWITYKRVGDLNGAQQLFFNPPSVKYCELTYYYLLPEMSSDSTTSAFPPEYEELLIIDVTAKCYEKLKMMDFSPAKQAEYKSKQEQLETSYKRLFDERIRDKQRLLSEKPRD